MSLTQTSEKSKRIASNTGAIYIRMIVVMLVTLYTSRVVLQQLGVIDFGINNVVAGIVSLLAFFSSSLSNAAQRYLSIGLGENNTSTTAAAMPPEVAVNPPVSTPSRPSSATALATPFARE